MQALNIVYDELNFLSNNFYLVVIFFHLGFRFVWNTTIWYLLFNIIKKK